MPRPPKKRESGQKPPSADAKARLDERRLRIEEWEQRRKWAEMLLKYGLFFFVAWMSSGAHLAEGLKALAAIVRK